MQAIAKAPQNVTRQAPTSAPAPPIRAAGTLLGEVAEPGDGISAAILRTSAEGATGLGGYLIWRA